MFVPAFKREQIPVDPCENSNDSGLGFDHHIDYHHPPHPLAVPLSSALRFSDKEVISFFIKFSITSIPKSALFK